MQVSPLPPQHSIDHCQRDQGEAGQTTANYQCHRWDPWVLHGLWRRRSKANQSVGGWTGFMRDSKSLLLPQRGEPIKTSTANANPPQRAPLMYCEPGHVCVGSKVVWDAYAQKTFHRKWYYKAMNGRRHRRHWTLASSALKCCFRLIQSSCTMANHKACNLELYH